MIWSFSKSRIFRKCQRQWFYKGCRASARPNDPVRRAADLLSKLQILSAWRGQIVGITIKLNDRRLFEDASEFDKHEINVYEEGVAV
jgi:hypothetical protein